jgi:hypothetical protein
MKTLPEFFKPILWSYDFSKINPFLLKNRIVSQSLNYGTIKHWKWLSSFYGKEVFLDIVRSIKDEEIKTKTKALLKVFLS